MVASRFIVLAKDRFDITSADEKTLDITKSGDIEAYFEKNTFDTVINFAAFTNVDAAEVQKGDEGGLVWKLNVEGPRSLAKVCFDKNIFLIHISTDFVFPGNEKNPGPYSEDTALPANSEGIGWYGWTKNKAERVIVDSGCKYAIIRYGYPFRADKYDLKLDWARNLLNLYDEHKMYSLFTDQAQSIVFIDDLVNPLEKIIDEKIEGVLHIASENTTTPHESGSYLLERYAGKPVEIQEGSMVEFLKSPGRTPRPRLGGLKVEKTEKLLGMKFKTWQEMIDEFITQLNS
ncbi:MAG: dTDP-4-dehydrorhamnose reductase [Candidatus Woesebacteria bacterium GW2011_GWD2_40_19]|nr:MAG: dTDP-4-dehydrorhamnose reductase [Candidatus Woesebacteria bacterium GW2011_GWD2_40_19]